MTRACRADEAMGRAYDWLCALPIAGSEPVFQMLRLFALAAIGGEGRPGHDANLRRLVEDLSEFDPGHISIDPVLALSVYMALLDQGLDHPSLRALTRAYATALSNDPAGPDDELALIASLCRRCRLDVRLPMGASRWVPRSTAEVMGYGRAETLEMCRAVLMISACGARALDLGNVRLLLPGLSLSYAMGWDIEATTTLIRTCVYAGVSGEPGCSWALDWLLDQQVGDGRFGLTAPETGYPGGQPADWRAFVGPTVNAAWCLTEVRRPGFLVLPT